MRPKSRMAGAVLMAAGVALHVTAWHGAGSGQAWGVWFYQAAWWSYIGIIGGLLALWLRSSLTTDRWRELVLMLPWSVLWWTAFDIYGLRLQNWYYVMLPQGRPERWMGFLVAFATVIPLVMVTHDLLRAIGLFDRVRWKPFVLRASRVRLLWLLGLLLFLMPLLAPRLMFPSTWLFAPLLMEPWLVRRGARSILSDVSEGRPAELLRLLVTGLVVGGLWELFNGHATSRWIYTVPGLEEGKLFEMPLLGFLGFPPFAVGTYSFWNMITAALRFPGDGRSIRPGRYVRKVALSLAVTVPLCVMGFAMIDRGTVRSSIPRVDDLPGWKPGMGIDGRGSALRLRDDDAAHVPPALWERWRGLLSMAQHRGMGLARALQLESIGARTPKHLGCCDSDSLAAQWPGHDTPRRAELEVWIAAARHGGCP